MTGFFVKIVVSILSKVLYAWARIRHGKTVADSSNAARVRYKRSKNTLS